MPTRTTSSHETPDWDAVATSVFRVGLSRGLGEEDARDVAQEATFRAWKEWSAGRLPHGGATAWAITAARFLGDQSFRNAATHQRIEAKYLHRKELGIEEGFAEQVGRQIDIWRAIPKLTDEARLLVELRYFANLSYEEIAVLLREPIGTVRSRAKRARDRLQELLGDAEEVNDD